MKKGSCVLISLFVAVLCANGQATLSQGRADVYYQAGLDLLVHHEYGTAYDAFGRFLDTHSPNDPRSIEAAYFRAYCAMTLLHADGELLLRQFLEAYPKHPRTFFAYYDLGNFFYEEKNYSKAAEYFAKVNFQSLDDERRGTGRFHWGYSLFSQRNFLESLDQFNTVKASAGQYGPAASYYAAFIELTVGDYDNALIDFKRAEMSPSYAGIVPPLIANAYQRQGKDDDLLRYAEPLLDRDDISSLDELALLTAEAWFRKSNYAKALPRYESYLEEHENAGRQVLYRAGYAAWATSNESLALSCLKRTASDLDSLGMYSSYLLGTIYLNKQEKPLALTAFETSKNFKQDPRIAEESLFLSAKINYDLGRPDIAIQLFESVLLLYPQSSHSVEIKELLSQAYVNANNFNKAIAYIEALPHRTAAVNRAYQKATYLKGTELFNKEEYAGAAVFFEKSLEYQLDELQAAEASYWLGETFSVGKKYDQAIPFYEKALAHHPLPKELVSSIHYGLGYARYNLQQYDKALPSFKEYASRGTQVANYVDGVLRMADCQYALKSYKESLASYRNVIQLKSIDSEYAHLQCGLILGLQRQYPEAEAELNVVVRTVGSRYTEEALFQLGQLDLEQSKYASAINRFTLLIKSAKSARFVPFALGRRATANYNLKNYTETANDYITVVEKYPTHSVAQDLLLPLQEALRLSGRSDEFDKYLSQFKHANPEAIGLESVEFESGKNYYFNQQYANAIGSLSAFVSSYPDSPLGSEARYYWAESYYRLKDLSKALELHKQNSLDQAFPLRSKVIARVAELEFKIQHYEAAATWFNQLARIAVNKKEEATAYFGLMESYFLLGQYDSTDVYARRIQQMGSINASAQSKASLFLGKSAKAKGDYETAQDEFLTTINSAQDEYGAEAKYLLAEIFYLKGEKTQCHETLISLNRDFAAYEDWVGKSFLLLADNYLAAGEVFQAKGTLKSLIENFPKPEVRDLAKEKLKTIETNELKKAAEEKVDSTDNKE